MTIHISSKFKDFLVLSIFSYPSERFLKQRFFLSLKLIYDFIKCLKMELCLLTIFRISVRDDRNPSRRISPSNLHSLLKFNNHHPVLRVCLQDFEETDRFPFSTVEQKALALIKNGGCTAVIDMKKE